MNRTFRLPAALAAAALWGALGAAHASTIPYFNGFGPSDDALDFMTAGRFVPNPGAGTLDYNVQNMNPAQSHFASEQLTNVPTAAGTGFVVETKVTLRTGAGNVLTSSTDASLGFMFLGNNADGNVAGSSYYLADWRVTQSTASMSPLGRLRILGTNVAPGVAPGIATSALGSASPVAEGDYVMRLVGLYDNTGALNLTLGVFDATGTTQLGTSATATTSTTPATGQYFGLRHRSGGHGGGSPAAGWITDASFDYFSVNAIPEPSTAVLGSIVAAMLARRSGRRVR